MNKGKLIIKKLIGVVMCGHTGGWVNAFEPSTKTPCDINKLLSEGWDIKNVHNITSSSGASTVSQAFALVELENLNK